jgi:hypothetical protein
MSSWKSQYSHSWQAGVRHSRIGNLPVGPMRGWWSFGRGPNKSALFRSPYLLHQLSGSPTQPMSGESLAAVVPTKSSRCRRHDNCEILA